MRNRLEKKKKNSDKEGGKNSLVHVVVLKESKRRGKKNCVFGELLCFRIC